MSFEDSKTYLNKRIKDEGKAEKFGEDVPIGRDKIKIKMENDVNPSNPWRIPKKNFGSTKDTKYI